MGPGGQEDRCPAPGEVVVVGVEEPCPIPRVVMKIFEDFGEGLWEESIIQFLPRKLYIVSVGRKPVSSTTLGLDPVSSSPTP